MLSSGNVSLARGVDLVPAFAVSSGAAVGADGLAAEDVLEPGALEQFVGDPIGSTKIYVKESLPRRAAGSLSALGGYLKDVRTVAEGQLVSERTQQMLSLLSVYGAALPAAFSVSTALCGAAKFSAGTLSTAGFWVWVTGLFSGKGVEKKAHSFDSQPIQEGWTSMGYSPYGPGQVEEELRIVASTDRKVEELLRMKVWAFRTLDEARTFFDANYPKKTRETEPNAVGVATIEWGRDKDVRIRSIRYTEPIHVEDDTQISAPHTVIEVEREVDGPVPSEIQDEAVKQVERDLGVKFEQLGSTSKAEFAPVRHKVALFYRFNADGDFWGVRLLEYYYRLGTGMLALGTTKEIPLSTKEWFMIGHL